MCTDALPQRQRRRPRRKESGGDCGPLDEGSVLDSQDEDVRARVEALATGTADREKIFGEPLLPVEDIAVKQAASVTAAAAEAISAETKHVNEWFGAQLAACRGGHTGGKIKGRIAHARDRQSAVGDSGEHTVSDMREEQADDADQQEVYARCTHFVSIPIDNISLLRRVASVQEAIVEAEPALRPGARDRAAPLHKMPAPCHARRQ